MKVKVAKYKKFISCVKILTVENIGTVIALIFSQLTKRGRFPDKTNLIQGGIL